MNNDIRLYTERVEDELLSPFAVRAIGAGNRLVEEQPDPLRTCFHRDRDRIIHSNAFRRLKYKTQVFLSPEKDHYRTRLTHTLEVSQIARTIARSLRLNEDLTEAIALGHDLGHTPFGHAGERALNGCFPGGFKHNEQSVRVVKELERNGRGLNLTEEVLDGILCHTSEVAKTLEGRIVRVADRIAYINHDIDDAKRAKVLSEEDIPADIREALGGKRSARINTLVQSVVMNSSDDIKMAADIQEYFDRLHTFMFEHVYTNPLAKGEEGKAVELVKQLYCYFCDHSDKLPDEYENILKNEGIERAVCDYIAGMTDRYAITVYNDLFVPNAWK